MSKLFRTVLAVNAAFLCLAGIYEWTFYLSPPRHAELVLPDSPASAANGHPSFWGFWSTPRKSRAIPGDARNTHLRRAAVIVFAYNRYSACLIFLNDQQLYIMSVVVTVHGLC